MKSTTTFILVVVLLSTSIAGAKMMPGALDVTFASDGSVVFQAESGSDT